jgi:hypothetical protein
MFQVIDLRPKGNLGQTILNFFLQREGLQQRDEALKLREKELKFEQEQAAAKAAAEQAEALRASQDLQAALALFNQPGQAAGPANLILAGETLGAPPALTTRAVEQAFPTEQEEATRAADIAEQEIDLVQRRRALQALTGGFTTEQFAAMVSADPTLFGVLAELGSSEPVRMLLRGQERKEEAARALGRDLTRFAAQTAGEIIKEQGLIGTPGITQGSMVDMILKGKSPEGLPPEAQEAIRRTRLTAQAAVVNAIMDAPDISTMIALRDAELQAAKPNEDKIVELQGLINKEVRREFGPQASTLLPEFVEVPGRDGVGPGGRTILTDPVEQLGARLLFEKHKGNLDAALADMNNIIQANLDPNQVAIAQAVLPFLMEFRENEGVLRKLQRKLGLVAKPFKP